MAVVGGWKGFLGGFLFGGVARVVAVQHCTFFINSACHTFGNQPYSDRCSAKDSGFMALFTFGEGYHNYHHEFQHDYRNGVKPWQWDPTKWAIWSFEKMGLTSNLRRVPSEKILLAQISQAQQVTQAKLAAGEMSLSESTRALLQASSDYLTDLSNRWAVQRKEYMKRTEETLEKLLRGDEGNARGVQDGAGAPAVRQDHWGDALSARRAAARLNERGPHKQEFGLHPDVFF